MSWICIDFEIKHLGEYHYLHLKSDTLLLADVFKNFQKNVFKHFLFRSCKISFSSWISIARSFKKDWSKIRIINSYWNAINDLEVIRGGTRDTIYCYAKANKKYVKDYDKDKESSYLKYWDVKNLYGWAMLQKPPVNKFKWIENTSQCNEDFMIKKVMKDNF